MPSTYLPGSVAIRRHADHVAARAACIALHRVIRIGSHIGFPLEHLEVRAARLDDHTRR